VARGGRGRALHGRAARRRAAARGHADLSARGALLAALALAAAPARAWGPEAHAIVGELAERRLSPSARARAEALLGGARISDVEVAAWADVESAEGRAPRSAHYVNVPVGARGYDPARDCRGGRCIVAWLERELAVLADRGAPARRRAEALRWVVHLVADAHQPLHCADRGDRGGNEARVLRRGRDTNLHAVWDGLGRRCDVGAAPPRGAADGDPRAWIDECHALGREVYAEAARHETGRGLRLDPGYAERQCAVVGRQLARAGARLAAAIERALAEAGAPPPRRAPRAAAR
jgi:hypothetical protein